MMSEPHNPLQDWSIPLAAIGTAGVARDFEASRAQCDQVADHLAIVACHRLSASVRLKPQASGEVAMTGRLIARITQACSVSLEPFEQEVREEIDCVFAEQPRDEPSAEDEELPILTATEYEQMEGPDVPVGRIVYETLAAGMDPFPRKPDASEETEWSTMTAKEREQANPFSVLRNLKK